MYMAMANEGSKAIIEGVAEQEQPTPSDLEGWSKGVEDLVDGGDDEGAVQLLEKVVASLQVRGDAATNLGLAAALNDLGRIYASQGLSLKSDDVVNSALLIKHRRAQAPGHIWDGPRLYEQQSIPMAPNVIAIQLKLPSMKPLLFREDKIDDLSQKGTQHTTNAASSGSPSNAGDVNDYNRFQRLGNSLGEVSTAGEREEGDWESVLDELPTPLKTSSSTIQKQHSNQTSESKQRGRGAFTYGGRGMYSDNLELTAEGDGPGNGSDQSDHSVDGGASHVLVLTFSPKTKTKDLENLIKPFSSKGSCSVRWVDDTRALAVFSSPIMARDALAGIKDARFKVSMLFETNEISGSQLTIKDLAPPGPRPASSARVAERMIASALSRQGVSKALLVKNQGSVREIQKQERQRKERLQSRAQLRDEAWGSDN